MAQEAGKLLAVPLLFITRYAIHRSRTHIRSFSPARAYSPRPRLSEGYPLLLFPFFAICIILPRRSRKCQDYKSEMFTKLLFPLFFDSFFGSLHRFPFFREICINIFIFYFPVSSYKTFFDDFISLACTVS